MAWVMGAVQATSASAANNSFFMNDPLSYGGVAPAQQRGNFTVGVFLKDHFKVTRTIFQTFLRFI
jgi:hypothetical protein